MKLSLTNSLLSLALLASAASAQNMLASPSFETPGLGGWGFFGNAFGEATNLGAGIDPRTGGSLCKLYGSFSGGFNVSGIFQQFPALPGQQFTIDCYSRHWSGDPMIGLGATNGDNWAVMKVAFFDAAGNEIGNAEQIILDGTYNTDIWIDNPPVTGTAPPNTVQVGAYVLYLQPGMAGGAALFDDVELIGPPSTPAYSGTGEDLELSSAVGGLFPSGGPGNDIKQAFGGDLLTFRVSSPNGAFRQKGYFLTGQLIATGAPPVPNPAFPELWFDINLVFIMVSGIPTQLGAPLIGPQGSSTYFVAPSNFAGLSLMVQCLVLDNSSNNAFYAASDAHEIQFQ
jgi:hypothetical protein